MPDLGSLLVPLYGRDLVFLPDDTVIGQIPGTTRVGRGASVAAMTAFAYVRGCSCIAGRYAHLIDPTGTVVPGGYVGLFDAFSGATLGADMGLVADYAQARGLAGQDGTIAIVLDYHAGVGLRLACPDGTSVDVPAAAFADYRQAGVLDKTRALWLSTNGGVVTCGDLPVPQRLPGALYYPQPLEIGGRLWLGYHTGTRIVLHPFDSFQGYSFPAGFYPRFRANGTKVAVVWAASQADDPAAGVQVVDVSSTPTVDLNPPVPAPAVSFSFAHRVLVAVFKDPDGQTSAPAEIVVNQSGQKAARPYIVAEDSLGGPFVGARLGIYTEAIDPAAAVAIAAGTRVVACHDAPDAYPASSLARLRPYDVPLLELYLVAGETAAAAAARWTANMTGLLRAWPGDVGVDLMFYCEGAPPLELFTVAQVLEALGHVCAVVNLSDRIKLLAVFEYLRANGITDHPELADAFTALLAAAEAAGLPILTPVDQPAPSPLPTPAPVPRPDPVPPPEPVRPVVLTPYPAAHVYERTV